MPPGNCEEVVPENCEEVAENCEEVVPENYEEVVPENYEEVVPENCVEVVLGSRAWTLQEEDPGREKEGAAFGAAFLRVDMPSECKRSVVWSRKVAAVSPCSQHAVSCCGGGPTPLPRPSFAESTGSYPRSPYLYTVPGALQ